MHNDNYLEEDEDYSNDSDWDDDYCYECKGYGDDYYINDDGEFECRCFDCPHNSINYDE